MKVKRRGGWGLGAVTIMGWSMMLVPLVAAADDAVVSVDGQVRVRTEVDRRPFRSDIAVKQYTDLRTRLGVKAQKNENARAYIQLQDSRRFGTLNSGSLASSANVDVFQAFLEVDSFFKKDWGLKAGRFEVNLGNERVFGAVDWHNVGRSWDGFNTWVTTDKVRVDGFWLKPLERNDSEQNRDFDIVGAQASFPEPGLEVFAFIENDAKRSNGPQPGRLRRVDLGTHAKRQFDRMDAEVNLVLQTGKQNAGAGAARGAEPISQYDLSAFLATVEVGTKVGEKSRVAAGVDYASGDDDSSDDKIATYDNIFYTGHKFRGFMDYFLGSAGPGLLDLVLRGRTNPAAGWTLTGDLHYFRTAAEYTDSSGDKTNALGLELDLGASTTRVAGVATSIGASLFLPSESFAGRGSPDPGLWFYSMVTAGF